MNFVIWPKFITFPNLDPFFLHTSQHLEQVNRVTQIGIFQLTPIKKLEIQQQL